MSSIIPIPASRVSDQLVNQTLLAQLQSDARDLFAIQSQISTGRRVGVPSEDAPAAQRAISLQRLIERKTQVQTNLATSQSYLSATDAALNSVSSLLNDVRGSALSVVDTTTTDQQRAAVAAEVSRAVQQLLDTSNQNFRGRYLFAGTTTSVQPFSIDGEYVRYNGNEGALSSFSDIDVLFESSIDGNSVFGAISAAVHGDTDLNRAITADTRLDDLNGGLGVNKGSIAISDGTNVSTIDLSNAYTLGDVAQLIEQAPPAGRTITATTTSTGLTVEIDSAGGGNLTITDVGAGTTARELGILEVDGVLTNPIVGDDLNPALRLTTSLNDILGSRATARVVSPGPNNDMLLEATSNGAELNDVTVQLVNDGLLQAAPGILAGNEFAEYDAAARAATASLKLVGGDNDLVLIANTPGVDYNNVAISFVNAGDVKGNPTAVYNAGAGTLTLGIDDTGETTLDDLVAAIELNTPFTVAADNSAGEGYDGGSTVVTTNIGNISGNTGNSGGEAGTLYVNIRPGSSNARDVAAAISAEGTFAAVVDSRDAVSVAQNGTGAVALTATGTTVGGSGINFDRDSGVQITNGGDTYVVSFAAAETVEDVLNLLNSSPANVVAQLNATGTGINVRSRLSGSDFSIGENGGTTATELGIRSLTGTTTIASLNRNRGIGAADGTDFTVTRSDGVALDIDVSAAQTIDDVFNLINNHVDNVGAGAVVAQLAEFGSGIELVESNPTFGETLTVSSDLSNTAGQDLGLIAVGETSNTATVTGGGTLQTLTGRDVNPIETGGVFNTLLRLEDALLSNDIVEVGRTMELLDEDLARINFSRADIGARQQGLEVLQFRLEDEEVQLRASLSEEIDVDITEAISDLTARQLAYQAALQTTATSLQISLLNFL